MSFTILNHLLHRKDHHKNDIALQFKEQDRWIRYNWREYYGLIEAVGAHLISVGLQRGERVALISNTRPEWIMSDLAIMGAGGITVPIYPNNLDEDVEYILNDSQARFLILEDEDQLEKWKRIQSKCKTVERVFIFERLEEESTEVVSWMEALTHGRTTLGAEPRLYAEEAKRATRDDIATILYTSGTTGRPKGVVIGHEQIMSELEDVFSMVTVTQEDISLSFLPYSHILGRVEAWGSVYSGYVLAFAESIDKIKSNLKEVRPTFMIAVPRIFEKIYSGILAQVENNQVKRRVFERALEIGKRVSQCVQKNQPLGLPLSAEFELAKTLVFNNVLRAMGGRMRFAVSGGAPLSADIARFFHGIGLLICEGYGLTETTAGICFNSPLAYKFGSVGRPLSDVDIRIADDGEILVKSKKVMREYYNNPDATAEAIVDGYFKTGDIGYLDQDGFLFITDRKKDLIKTAGGKYVAPQKLENLLKMCPHISNVLIHGDQKKYIVALITLTGPLAQKSQEPETYKAIRDAVAEANTQLASHESIKKFTILPHDFTVERGELTPSLKVRRRFCDQKFKAQIEELYD